jgi:hypothetical protein
LKTRVAPESDDLVDAGRRGGEASTVASPVSIKRNKHRENEMITHNVNVSGDNTASHEAYNFELTGADRAAIGRFLMPPEELIGELRGGANLARPELQAAMLVQAVSGEAIAIEREMFFRPGAALHGAYPVARADYRDGCVRLRDLRLSRSSSAALAVRIPDRVVCTRTAAMPSRLARMAMCRQRTAMAAASSMASAMVGSSGIQGRARGRFSSGGIRPAHPLSTVQFRGNPC